jgi:hypothetical protein
MTKNNKLCKTMTLISIKCTNVKKFLVDWSRFVTAKKVKLALCGKSRRIFLQQYPSAVIDALIPELINNGFRNYL